MKIRPLYDRIVVKRIEEKETMQGGLYIPDSAKENRRKAKSSPSARASVSKTAKSCRSTSRLAIASCSASIPAATSSWMAMSS